MSNNSENNENNQIIENSENDKLIEKPESNFLDDLKLKFINYYIFLGNIILTQYNRLYDSMFLIKKITNPETKKNMIYKYYFLYWFYSFIKFYCRFVPLILTPTSVFRFFIRIFDKPQKVLYMSLSKNNITRNIFIQNSTMSKIMTELILKDTMFDQNQLIMMKRVIIIDISLESCDTNYSNISLKETISKYADKDKNFEDNTLKNILLNENINYEKYNTIKITSLKIIKREVKELNLSENLDKHVSFFFE